MRTYETIFILKADLDESAVEAQTQKVKSLIESQNGTVESVENWGKKKLAYEIGKHRYGNYVFIIFKAEAAAIPVLEKHYRLSEEIFRHLTVLHNERICRKKDEKSESEEPSWKGKGEAPDQKAAVEEGAE